MINVCTCTSLSGTSHYSENGCAYVMLKHHIMSRISSFNIHFHFVHQKAGINPIFRNAYTYSLGRGLLEVATFTWYAIILPTPVMKCIYVYVLLQQGVGVTTTNGALSKFPMTARYPSDGALPQRSPPPVFPGLHLRPVCPVKILR